MRSSFRIRPYSHPSRRSSGRRTAPCRPTPRSQRGALRSAVRSFSLTRSVRPVSTASRGRNMASVSVDLVLPDWPLERILSHQLATYRRYATCEVGTLVSSGFEVLATGDRPHADVVL